MRVSKEEFLRLAMAEMDSVDRMARNLTRNSAEADDLVQETYLRALKAIDSFDLRTYGIKPWLLQILHNLYVTRVRREQRQPRGLESHALEAVAGAAPSEPLKDLPLSDERLEAALKALPSDLSAILLLWAVDELSYKEIAAVVDIPIGTVMSRLHRARQKISQLLSDHPAAG